MTWIRKARTVSGETVVFDSLSAKNLNCIKDEYNMISNSDTHVPTQKSVRDYVKTYATAPVIEGTVPNPSPEYIAALIKANNLRIDQGESVLYLYVYGGQVIDSRSVRLADDRKFSVDVVQGSTLDISNDISNYMHSPLRDDNFGFEGSWTTTDNFERTTDKSQIIATNAGVSDYAVGWNQFAYEIGETYTVTGNVTATDGNGCLARVYTAFPISYAGELLIGETTGTFSFSFVASSFNHLFAFQGTSDNPSITIEDLVIKKSASARTVTYTVNAALPHIKKFSVLSGSGDDLATLVVKHNDAVLQEGTFTEETTLPLVIEYSRSALGTSTSDIVIRGEIETDFVIDGSTITVQQDLVEFITLTVTV